MMHSLRKGSSGPLVRSLQEALKKLGYHVVPDAHFGAGTDAALRAYQRKLGMLPDGVAGPKTLGALGIQAPHSKAPAHPAQEISALISGVGSFISTPAYQALHTRALAPRQCYANAMDISENGLKFIYTEESQAGVSNHLYWPKGASGVTLGAGYDMKERSSREIVQDMTTLRLPPNIATAIGAAAGLRDQQADNFAKANKHLVNLSSEQEVGLLRLTVPRYIQKVRDSVYADLMPYEFDALVSFAYNPGGRFRTVARLINNGQILQAMTSISQAVTSKGNVMSGLVDRREKEIKLYIYGDYGKLRAI